MSKKLKSNNGENRQTLEQSENLVFKSQMDLINGKLELLDKKEKLLQN